MLNMQVTQGKTMMQDNIPRAFYHYSQQGIDTKQLLKDLYDRNEYFNKIRPTVVRDKIVQEERQKRLEWQSFIWSDAPTSNMLPVIIPPPELQDDLTIWRSQTRFDGRGRPFLYTRNMYEDTVDLVEALIMRYQRLRGELPAEILLSAMRYTDVSMVRKRGYYARGNDRVPYI